MKNTRKLIPALAMLLLSAVLMSTASFAWFSMNKTVTAGSMTVTAQSNATNLLINTTGKAAEGSADVAATTSHPDKLVYPVAYVTANTTVGGVSLNAGDWYTANNKNANSAADDITGVRTVTEGSEDFMITYKVYLTLSSESEAYTDGKIQVSYASLTGDAATKMVVVIGSEKLALDAVNATATTTANANLSKDAVTEVTIYVYLDGNSANVNSNYIAGGASLTGTAGLKFDLIDN